VQEPTDERQPDPRHEVAAKRGDGADGDEPECEDLAREGRELRRSVQAPGPPPERGPKDAAAVQRKAWQRVEDRQREIHLREPARGDADRGECGEHEPEDTEQPGQGQARQGAGQGDLGPSYLVRPG